MPKKRNSTKRKVLRGSRDGTIKARMKVLEAAKKRGIISSDKACQIGGWNQAWFHLNAMVKAGLLRHAGYNHWVPGSRR